MAYHLDDQAVELAGGTLAEVLESAQAALAESGRLIVEVSVDGQGLSGEALEAGLNKPVSGELRLTSAAPGAVAAEALSAVKAELAEARTLQSEAADLLQRDEASDGLRKVSEAIQAWLSTQQAVIQSATMLGVDLEAFEVGGTDLTDSVNDLVAQLRELKELIEAGDTIGLADALAYEWPGITDQWDALLGALLDHANRADA